MKRTLQSFEMCVTYNISTPFGVHCFATLKHRLDSFSFSIRIESEPLHRHLNRKRVTKVAISVGDVYCLRRGCSAFRTRVNIYLDFDLHLSERLEKEVGKVVLPSYG